MSNYAVKDPIELKRIYSARFDRMLNYRMAVWQILVAHYFQRYVPEESTVMDLGCGYGEFINYVKCRRKYAMDLNVCARAHLSTTVELIDQDCSEEWAIHDNDLDIVFSSNFFEHLPDKLALKKTIIQIHRCLKPGGKLIALGPNIKYVNGAYWDFWDHFLCLTDRSLAEALSNNGFDIELVLPRFLPYTMVGAVRVPLVLVRMYLALPVLWHLYGKQFLVVAVKRTNC